MIFSHYPSNILIHGIKAKTHHPQFYQKWVDMAGNHQNPAKYGSKIFIISMVYGCLWHCFSLTFSIFPIFFHILPSSQWLSKASPVPRVPRVPSHVSSNSRMAVAFCTAASSCNDHRAARNGGRFGGDAAELAEDGDSDPGANLTA